MSHQQNKDLIFDQKILPVCEPIIRSAAHRYRGLPEEDAMVAGKHGLVKGLLGYDPRRGLPRPYLRRCIHREILNAYLEHHGLPRWVCKVVAQISEARNDLFLRGCHAPSDQEVADYLATDVELIGAVAASLCPLPLEQEDECGNAFTPETIERAAQALQHPRLSNPVSLLIGAEMHHDLDYTLLQAFEKYFSKPSDRGRPRQWYAIFMGLNFQGLTQQQVAEKVKLSREQVNRIHGKMQEHQDNHRYSPRHQQNRLTDCWICLWLRYLEERGWSLEEITRPAG